MAPDIKVLASRFLIGLLAITAQALANTPMPSQSFFVANEGQWDGAFAFKCEIGNATYFLTSSGFTLDLRAIEPRRGASPEAPGHDGLRRGDSREFPPRGVKGHVLRLSYLNANPSPVLIGQDKFSSYSNYFLSRDSCRWRSRVGHYKSVIAQDVWPGIDVQYLVGAHGDAPVPGVETVYHIHPGADPAQIVLRYEGADGAIAIGADGGLHLPTSLGTVTEKAPFAYQIINRQQREIPCHFDVISDESYRLSVDAYDPSQELVIDPVIYCSYWGGGSMNDLWGIAEDAEHHKLLTGYVYMAESGFPITPGAYQAAAEGGAGFVSKLTAGGDTLLFSTFLGGVEQVAWAVAADPQGAVYVTGYVMNTCGALPLTPDAFDTSCAGPTEGFLQRFSADGTTLEFSSYFGGSNRDLPHAVAVDSAGLVYVSGSTTSPDFPVTPNALYPQFSGWRNGFLATYNPETSALTYSTYFPGQWTVPYGLVVGPNSRVWLFGENDNGGLPVTADALQSEIHGSADGFIAHLDVAADSLLYCSYIGGHGSSGTVEDYVGQVLPLADDTVVVCGTTRCSDFPVTTDAYDTGGTPFSQSKVFLTMIALPNTVIHSTLFGGGGADARLFAQGERGTYFVVGNPYAPNFPLTPNADDSSYTYTGLFVSQLSHDLRNLEYSTFLGGAGRIWPNGLLTDGRRQLWVGGTTDSDELPVTTDALVRINPVPSSLYGFYLGYALPQSSLAHPHPVALPRTFALSAFPNPFNPSTTLSFTLPSSSVVKLEVFDVLGRSVYQKDLGRLAAGEHRERFEGEELSSGIYFARVQAGGAVKVQKVILLK